MFPPTDKKNKEVRDVGRKCRQAESKLLEFYKRKDRGIVSVINSDKSMEWKGFSEKVKALRDKLKKRNKTKE